MDRKKPALTSPGKVGFLVALLLVVTSLGVSYFITGTFGVTWHWIHFGGLSPTTWTFHLGAFIEEMVPVAGLTLLLAFAAYVLVAGAVRRYKAYVDSGVEYKQLLKSIKSLEDLEDGDVTDRLKQHPELREFLMGFKHRAAAAERSHGERDRKHVNQAPPASRDERPRLQSESALLASAVSNGRDAFSHELALTVPELKQIERALRDYFASSPEPRGTSESAASEPAGSAELDALREHVRGTAKALRRDVDACATGARELETALAGLQTALQGGSTSAPSANSAEVQKRIDMTAQALGALGEETRRIAIASAMQASGGAEADSIKVADEVRALATKFNTVAQHWRDTAPALKELLGGGRGSNDGAAATAANVVSRARLWTERAIAINEHVRALESAAQTGDAAPARKVKPASPSADLDVRPSNEAASTSSNVDDFLTRGSGEVFGNDDDTTSSFADIPGFEKERKFFADASSVEDSDDRLAIDRAEEGRWDLNDEAEAPVSAAAPAAPAPAPAPTPAPASESSHDSDGFLTGPRPVVSPKKIAKAKEAPAPAAKAVPVETAAPSATATLDPDSDAIDLYALGAVDCVQTA